MRSLNGKRGGGSSPPPPAMAVRPIGDVGHPHRAAVAGKILHESVGLMGAKLGVRPVAGLIAYEYPDGGFTFLVAAPGPDQAGSVSARAYQALHALFEAGAVGSAGPTDPAPPPSAADDTGPQSPVVDEESQEQSEQSESETSSGPESSDP
jgi:hypothetical protein